MFCFECFQFDIEMPRRYHLSNRCENPFLFHSPARCHCHHHHHHRQQHHNCHHIPIHWNKKFICDWIHLDLWAQEQWFQASHREKICLFSKTSRWQFLRLANWRTCGWLADGGGGESQLKGEWEPAGRSKVRAEWQQQPRWQQPGGSNWKQWRRGRRQSIE